MEKTKEIVCPQCGKEETWVKNNKYKPFCSERCKLIDLGGWASEKYTIPNENKDHEIKDDDKE